MHVVHLDAYDIIITRVSYESLTSVVFDRCRGTTLGVLEWAAIPRFNQAAILLSRDNRAGSEVSLSTTLPIPCGIPWCGYVFAGVWMSMKFQITGLRGSLIGCVRLIIGVIYRCNIHVIYIKLPCLTTNMFFYIPSINTNK